MVDYRGFYPYAKAGKLIMRISSNFDSGNIIVTKAESPDDIQLEIAKDNQSDFYQWFHFKLDSTPLVTHKLHINNLKTSAYPDGWKDYHALASYDRQEWFRVDCAFNGESLVIEHTPEYEHTYYAYFVPYSYERHLNLIAEAQTSFDCQQVYLGETLDGRDMTLLQIGQVDEGKKTHLDHCPSASWRNHG